MCFPHSVLFLQVWVFMTHMNKSGYNLSSLTKVKKNLKTCAFLALRYVSCSKQSKHVLLGSYCTDVFLIIFVQITMLNGERPCLTLLFLLNETRLGLWRFRSRSFYALAELPDRLHWHVDNVPRPSVWQLGCNKCLICTVSFKEDMTHYCETVVVVVVTAVIMMFLLVQIGQICW